MNSIEMHSEPLNRSFKLTQSKSNPELFKCQKRKHLQKLNSLHSDLNQEPLFSQVFYTQNDSDTVCVTLVLTKTHLLIKDGFLTTKINLADIIGASICEPSSPIMPPDHAVGDTISPNVFALKVHVFSKPLEQNVSSLKNPRKEYDCTYYTNDTLIATAWMRLILHAANNPRFQEICSNCSDPLDFPPFQKKYLVIINSKCGEKKGDEIWQTSRKFLLKAGCTFYEMCSEYIGHIKTFILELDLSKIKEYDGFLVVGGDGTCHELVNSIMKRPDWTEIKDVPIGIIPAGGNNGILASLILKSKEIYDANHACYLIAKGETTKADVTLIERENEQPNYCVSSLLWGTLPHSDFSSEKYSFLGNHRFDLYGTLALIMNKKYKATVTVSNSSTDLPLLDEPINGEAWESMRDEFTYFGIYNLACATFETTIAPFADFQDGYNHLLALKGKSCTRANLMRLWMEADQTLFENGKLKERTGLTYQKIKSFRVEPRGSRDKCFYSIDGEKYDGGKIQGQVLDKLFTFFSK